MSKVNCPCGWQISNVESPSPNNGWFITDKQEDDMYWEEEGLMPGELADRFWNVAIDVWECHKCGRIAFGNKQDNTIRWYLPEKKQKMLTQDREPEGVE